MTSHLVTFSDESMSYSRELCMKSAKRWGIAMRWPYIAPLTEDFPEVAQHWMIFCNPRGVGLWAWKPLLIKEVMSKVADGDILIYADAGVEFINNVNHIIDRMDQDIFLFGNMYEHAHWCKRDIVEEVWDLIALDQPYYDYSPRRKGNLLRDENGDLSWDNFGKQVQASVIFFRVNDKTKKFVKEWLDWCLFENGRLIDDSPSRTPNHPEFKENRHDQAILTTMAYRDGYKLHWWPANYNDGQFIYPRGDYPDEGYPVLFHHHRRRNHEWEQVA